MISFGPTLRDVHSPNERIEIATVGLWWSHLLELLRASRKINQRFFALLKKRKDTITVSILFFM